MTLARMNLVVLRVIGTFLFTCEEGRLLLSAGSLLRLQPNFLVDARYCCHMFLVWQQGRLEEEEQYRASPSPSLGYEPDTD